MSGVNLASKYSKKVDEKFALEELTGAMGGADYDFVGVNAVKVYSIEDAPLNDYTRSGSQRYGSPAELEDSVQTLTLTQDKAFTFTIDRGNNNEQMMIKEAGKALARQIKNVVVPTRDAYNLGRAAIEAINNGNAIYATLSTSNAYEKWLAATEIMDEGKVPMKGRKGWVAPSYLNLIKRCSDFTKILEYNKNTKTINGEVGNMEDVAIVKTPSTYLPVGVKAVLEHPIAMATPKTLADYKIHDNPPGINGWLVEGRIIYDAFVLNEKAKGIVVVVDGAILGIKTKSVAGAATNGTKLSYELPEGVKTSDVSSIVYKLNTSAITLPAYGATFTGGTTYTDAEIAASTNTHYAIVGLDSNGKAVFADGGTLVKG